MLVEPFTMGDPRVEPLRVEPLQVEPLQGTLLVEPLLGTLRVEPPTCGAPTTGLF